MIMYKNKDGGLVIDFQGEAIFSKKGEFNSHCDIIESMKILTSFKNVIFISTDEKELLKNENMV